MLGLWEDPATGGILHSIFLTAAHEPLAMERLREAFARSVLAVVSKIRWRVRSATCGRAWRRHKS